MDCPHGTTDCFVHNAPALQQGTVRPTVDKTQSSSNRLVPLKLEHQAARQVGAALARRGVTGIVEGGQAQPDPSFSELLLLLDQARAVMLPVDDRCMPLFDTITQVLLGHAGGERLPSTEEQMALCAFLHRLDEGHKSALRLADPFMMLAKQQDEQGHSLLYLAVSKGLNGLVGWLLNTQPPPFSVMAPFTGKNDEQTSPLHLAMTKGNESITSLFLEKNTDVNLRDFFNQTLLHWVTRMGYETIARLLLNKNADINAQDFFRRTPLHSVAIKGYERIAHLLLDHNADVDRQDCCGESPLHWAVEVGRESMVCLLTDRGADINLRDKYRKSPLHKAIEKGNKKMVCLLVGKGADANLPYGFGQYPLHWAVERGYDGLASVLVDKGADVNVQDNFGKSPLSRAVDLRDERMVCLLVDRGADIHSEDIFKQSPLSLAIANGDTTIVQLLENRRALQEPD